MSPAGQLAVALALCAVGACAAAVERSRTERAAFQRVTPCPANGARSGPCPGWQIDHIQPLCAHGRDSTDNMQWLDVESHKAKTRKDVAGCFERPYKPRLE